jgi:hypothetical protein
VMMAQELRELAAPVRRAGRLLVRGVRHDLPVFLATLSKGSTRTPESHGPIRLCPARSGSAC